MLPRRVRLADDQPRTCTSGRTARVSLISDGTTSTGAVLGGTTPSGNDVFFTTMAQLVPQDADGYDDIYDARVGGGFPAPPGPGARSAVPPESCRTGVTPTEFFPSRAARR